MCKASAAGVECYAHHDCASNQCVAASDGAAYCQAGPVVNIRTAEECFCGYATPQSTQAELAAIKACMAYAKYCPSLPEPTPPAPNPSI